jgi:hypothetical protein
MNAITCKWFEARNKAGATCSWIKAEQRRGQEHFIGWMTVGLAVTGLFRPGYSLMSNLLPRAGIRYPACLMIAGLGLTLLLSSQRSVTTIKTVTLGLIATIWIGATISAFVEQSVGPSVIYGTIVGGYCIALFYAKAQAWHAAS